MSTLTVLALVTGLPLGVAAGWWAWALFAAGLGVPAGTLIPATVILVIVPAVLLAANAPRSGRVARPPGCGLPRYCGPNKGRCQAR